MRKDRSPAMQTDSDPVHTVYLLADAVEHLADTLPQEQGGLSYLLRLVGRDAKEQARSLDDAENGQ